MAIWHSIRRQQLLHEPRACSMAGRVKAATEVDHIVEHGGEKTTMLIVEQKWFARDAQP
jgi:hypothetical protein